MSAVTTDDVLSHVETTMDVYDIQELIDEEEAWLSRRIGPLVGERTERFDAPGIWDYLQLRRPTDSVVVVDNDVDVDADDLLLRSNGWRIGRLTGHWAGILEVTYTPNDWFEVRRAVTDLVRTAIAVVGQQASEGVYEAETIGEYSYRRARGSNAPSAQRLSVLASLIAPKFPSSMKLLTSVSVDTTARRAVHVW